MKPFALLFACILSFSVHAQWKTLSVEELEIKKSEAINSRDFTMAETLNQELLSRKSLAELTDYFTALKNQAVEENEYEKADFYKNKLSAMAELAQLEDAIQEKVREEAYTEANSLQEQFNSLKKRTISAKFDSLNSLSQPSTKQARVANTLNGVLTSATTGNTSDSKAPSISKKEIYYVKSVDIMGIASYTNPTQGEFQFGIENTHFWNTTKVKPMKGVQQVNHGNVIGGISYGIRYFDYQIDNLGTYGMTAWTKGGVGYAYHNEMGSIFASVNQPIVVYSETTTSFYDFNGYYDYIDSYNTSWFPDNGATFKFGAVVLYPFAQRKSNDQFKISLQMETPINGSTSMFWIGIGTTHYKKY